MSADHRRVCVYTGTCVYRCPHTWKEPTRKPSFFFSYLPPGCQVLWRETRSPSPWAGTAVSSSVCSAPLFLPLPSGYGLLPQKSLPSLSQSFRRHQHGRAPSSFPSELCMVAHATPHNCSRVHTSYLKVAFSSFSSVPSLSSSASYHVHPPLPFTRSPRRKAFSTVPIPISSFSISISSSFPSCHSV